MQRKVVSAAALLCCLAGVNAAPPGPAAGKVFFNANCAACHSVEPGPSSLAGPSLSGVVGRKVGSVPGFKYSNALAKAGTSGKVWTREELDVFLIDPDAAMPDTLMPVSVEDPEERAKLLDYLQTLTGRQEAAGKGTTK